MSLSPGVLLKERYKITSLIASSGMGNIYLAEDQTLKTQVAVKENLYSSVDHSRQFRREATLLANLRHPNLPRVIDHFVLPGMGEYLVMDYVPGQDLREKVTSLRKPMSEAEAVAIGVKIAQALSYLHTRTPPIIHRDVKPANIKMTPEGDVVLVDFGLAKVQTTDLTEAGVQGVTPGFSPVEQYGEGADARSDIYALGATLYYMLSGRVPLEALDRALGTDKLVPLMKINSKVSQATAAVIDQAMALEADLRFQSMDEFVQALLTACPAAASLAEGAPLASAGEENAAGKAGGKPRKSKTLLWLLPILLFLVGAGALGLKNGFFAKQPLQPTATELVNTMEAAATSLPEPTATLTEIAKPSATEIPPTVAAPTATSTPEPTATSTITPTGVGGGFGQFAYVSQPDGKLPQIWLMSADGSTPSQLTNEVGGACQPAWSGDGKKLAYISPCKGRAERYDGARLFVYNMDTKVIDVISSFANGDYDPAWSADNQQLAFTSLATGRPQIHIYDFKSKKSTLMLAGSMVNQQPAWDWQTPKIAFVSRSPVNNFNQIWSYDLISLATPRMVAEGVWKETYHPTWAPDGSAIWFDLGVNNGIAGKVIGGGELTLDTGVRLPENPSISPDGSWMLFDGLNDSGLREVFLISMGGGSATSMTGNASITYDPTWRPGSN